MTISLNYASNVQFAGWSGACTGTAPTCSVVMTGDIYVGVSLPRVSR